jgi:hypothetical protein
MTYRVLRLFAWAVLIPAVALAQQASGTAGRRAAAAHPDLSGIWSYAIDRAPAALKKEVNGVVTIVQIDQSARHGDATSVRGVRPSTPKPSYKAEFHAKVQDLFDHQSKTDPVFYCSRPGVPRIGPPRKIVQLPNETVFFYETSRAIRTGSSRPTAVPIANGPIRRTTATR